MLSRAYWAQAGVIYRFEEFELDLDRLHLRHGDRIVPMEPKVFDVLRYLTLHHDRVVPKAELLEEVWAGDVVTEAVLPNNVAIVRRILGQRRGQKQPIETVHGRGYRLSSPVREVMTGSAPGPVAVVSSKEDPFVGRADVMQLLEQRWSDVLGARGSLVLLSGVAGIGKTRTAEQFGHNVSGHGGSVMWGRCYEGEGAPEFWPWVQVLRALVTEDSAETVAGWAGVHRNVLGGLVADLLEADSTPQAMDTPAARFAVCDAMVAVLRRAASARPRIVILDDLQWAHSSSMRLLLLLVDALTNSRLMVLATARQRELPLEHSNRAAVLELLRASRSELVRMDGLTESEAAVYLAGLVGGRLPSRLIRELLERTDGNALFLREVVRSLGRTSKEVVANYRPDTPPPPGTAEIVRRSLQRLGPSTREVLACAAVLGRVVELPILEALMDRPHDQILDAVDDAAVHGVLHRGERGFRFVQNTVREVLYADMPTGTRVDLHLKAADTLVTRLGHADGAYLQAVAEHLHRALPAADPKRAKEYTLRAADSAAKVGAFRQAARLYELALEAMSFSGGEAAEACCGIMIRLGQCQLAGCDFARAGESFVQAMDTARKNDLPLLHCEAALHLARGVLRDLISGNYSLEVLREAFVMAPKGQPALRAQLLAALALWSGTEGDARYKERMAEAVALLEGTNDLRATLRVNLWRGHTMGFADGDPVARRQMIKDSLGLLNGSDVSRSSAAPNMSMPAPRFEVYRVELIIGHAEALNRLGRVSAAYRALEQATSVARSFGWRTATWNCQAFEVERQIAEGRLDDARLAVAEMGVLAEGADFPLGQLWQRTVGERINLLSGDTLGYGEAELRELAEPETRSQIVARVAAAALAERAGHAALAREMLHSCIAQECVRARHHRSSAWLLALLAETAARLEDSTAAEAIYRALKPCTGQHGVGPLFQSTGAVELHLGVMAHLMGRHDEALGSVREAIQRNRDMGLPLYACAAELALARLAQPGRDGRAQQQQALENARLGALALGASLPALELLPSSG